MFKDHAPAFPADYASPAAIAVPVESVPDMHAYMPCQLSAQAQQNLKGCWQVRDYDQVRTVGLLKGVRRAVLAGWSEKVRLDADETGHAAAIRVGMRELKTQVHVVQDGFLGAYEAREAGRRTLVLGYLMQVPEELRYSTPQVQRLFAANAEGLHPSLRRGDVKLLTQKAHCLKLFC